MVQITGYVLLLCTKVEKLNNELVLVEVFNKKGSSQNGVRPVKQADELIYLSA